MAVSGLLGAILLLLFEARSKMTLAEKGNDFFTACPPSHCGKEGPEIRYPFRLNSSPTNCSARGLVLSCSGNDTLLSLPESGSHKVIAIDYLHSEITIEVVPSKITIKIGDTWSDCQVQNFSFTNLTTLPFSEPRVKTFRLVKCSIAWTNGSAMLRGDYEVIPISCFSRTDRLVYMADIYMPMVLLPPDCVVVSTTNLVLRSVFDDVEWETDPYDYVKSGEVNLRWFLQEIGYECERCEYEGGRCKFDWKINGSSCSFPEHPGELQYSFCG